MKKLNYKTLIIVGVIIVALVGLVQLSKSSSSDAQNSSQENGGSNPLVLDETSYDFGRISMAAGNVNHTFKVRNTSAEPITIKKIYTSCMCTNVTFVLGGETSGPYGMQGHGIVPEVNRIIGPNEEADIEVVYDPTAHGPAGVGRIERDVYIETENNLPLRIRIKTFVTP